MKRSAEQKAQLAKIFDVGDPLAYWKDRARAAAEGLRLDRALVEETVPVIQKKLGDTWLRKELKKSIRMCG